uniref:Uncharacterized protein n=1 Tax=Pristionchus pacificus TaxID=54126 RepID=A0A2A6CKY4_PRIPA|eukprot:PDM78779.1 hypothetical protein PRIPAC_31358 [Pristionchus pacificus]
MMTSVGPIGSVIARIVNREHTIISKLGRETSRQVARTALLLGVGLAHRAIVIHIVEELIKSIIAAFNSKTLYDLTIVKYGNVRYVIFYRKLLGDRRITAKSSRTLKIIAKVSTIEWCTMVNMSWNGTGDGRDSFYLGNEMQTTLIAYPDLATSDMN